MNVIIADDERLVRSSLRSMLEELNIPLNIVGEARNGEEMLDLVRTASPNLVFVDIKMPKLDGLEAIRIGKSIAPEASWVIISGLSEFKYAQEALRLGASNYLLKPAEPEELEKCVHQAIDEHQKTSYYLNCEFEHWIATRLHKSRSDAEKIGAHSYEGYCFSAMALYSNCGSDATIDRADKLRQVVSDVQQTLLRGIEFKDLRSGIVQLQKEHLTCFWAWPRMGSRRDKERLATLDRLLASLFLQNSEQLPVYVLQTEIIEDMDALPAQMDEINKYSPLRIFYPMRKSLSLSELRKYNDKYNCLPLAESLHQLVSLYHNNDYVGYLQKLSSIKKNYSKFLFNVSSGLNHVSDFLANAIQSKINVGMSPDEWFLTFQHQGDAMLSITNGTIASSQGDIIQRVIQYVDRHFMEEISLGALAGEFNVTPNYLSTLFHKRNNVTFVKYLTNTRMLKAKELLLTRPELKVQDVAQAVGYFSSRHFTKLFIEQFKCYPSEIRERNG